MKRVRHISAVYDSKIKAKVTLEVSGTDDHGRPSFIRHVDHFHDHLITGLQAAGFSASKIKSK